MGMFCLKLIPRNAADSQKTGHLFERLSFDPKSPVLSASSMSQKTIFQEGKINKEIKALFILQQT